MIHISLILCFLVIVLHDTILKDTLVPWFEPWPAAAASLFPFFLLITLTHVMIESLGKTLDKSGAWTAVHRAENLIRRGRFLAVGFHVFNVFFVGWSDAVRALTGDIILLDEVLIIAPVLLTWTLGWWSIEPIERRIREASLVRDLDAGKPLYPIVTRWQFVLSNLRYHVFLLLIPMLILLAWAETVERMAPRVLGSVPSTTGGPPQLDPAMVPVATVMQLAGVFLLFILMPLGLRMVWDTIPMGPGLMRHTLESLCRRCRCKVGDLLVWRTHGLMLNGAVIGLFWPLRYILLTDALLDALTPAEVEAVTAHEVGHVRRRHLLWLAGTMLSALMTASLILSGVRFALFFVAPELAASAVMEAVLALGSLLFALIALGYVSRRFEWQADAYAVAAISRVPAPGELGPDGVGPIIATRPSKIVTPEAVAAMHGALTTVARASGLPIRKFTWRHGSIWTRQQRLMALINRPINRLRIDSEVRWLKFTIALVGILMIAITIGLYLFGTLLSALYPTVP
jgi:STE24 endopeptidase